jgi:hypothetical protein
MQENTILSKRIKLSELVSRDPKTRRLFILTNGERTLADLNKLCGFNAAEGASIAIALIKDGAISTSNSIQTSKNVQADSRAQEPVPGTIADKVTDELAVYLGPIAAVLVSRSIRSDEEVSRTELETIFLTLVQQIEEEEDQVKCLHNLRALL